MNAAHIHLILNHIPVIGAGFAFFLLLYGILRRNIDITKAGLLAFVSVAIIAIPVYLTGEPAEDIMKAQPGVTRTAIEAHEDAAGAALVGMGILGVISLAALWFWRHRPISNKVLSATLLLALLTMGLMAWTANLGGKIRHPEITGFGAPANDVSTSALPARTPSR